MKLDDQLDGFYGPFIKVGVVVILFLWLAVVTLCLWAVVQDASRGTLVIHSKDLVIPMIAGTGVLIAYLAFLRDRQKITRDQSEAKSKILYEQAKSGLESAYDLLKDRNNDRVIWIRAARMMASAVKLSRQITSLEYGEAYRLAEDAVRARLYDTFMPKNERGQRVALPAAFFFGHSDWQTFEGTTEELAIATSHQGGVFSVRLGYPLPEPHVVQLSPDSVAMVMGFIQFPKDYRDPLKEVELPAATAWADTYGPQQGATHYLSFINEFRIGNGKVYKKGENQKDQGCA